MSRGRLLTAARASFVVVALALAAWGFRGREAEVVDAIAAVGPTRLAAAVGCAGAGLALTSVLWRLLLGWLGSAVPARDAAAVFFVGQLGKYVPGSVWSVAAQADLGRRHGVPVRSSVAASATFLLVHTATGLLVGGLALATGLLEAPTDPLWAHAAVAAGAGCLVPPALRLLATRLAGTGAAVRIGPAQVGAAVALMVATWLLHGASLAVLLPDGPGLAGAAGAFALAHAVGVLVVVAPAGLGVRESLLVALLAPTVGVPAAAAAALLSRVAHAVADVLAAGVSGVVAGGRRLLVPARLARALPGRPDAVPLLAAGLLLGVGVQLALSSSVPSWANDEPAHVGYVAALAEGRLPTIETDIVDDPARFPLTAEEFAGRDEEHGDVWTANHPPLFHLAMVPVWWALHDVNQSGMVITMRIANTLGFAAWVYLLGLLVRHLLPGRPAVAALATVVAVTPTLVLRSSYAQNDGWASAAAVLLLLAVVRMLREEVTPPRVALAAAAGTLAAGMRAQGVLLVALCSVVLMVVLTHRGGWSWPAWRRGLTVSAVVGGVPAAAVGWFYLRNLRLYGDLTGQDALLDKFDRAPVALVHLVGVRTLEQPVQATALVLVAAVLLVPAAAVASVRRHGLRVEPVWALLVLHAGLTLVSLVGFMRAGGGFHDRYLMQVMPLLATATAVGMVGAASRWRGAPLTPRGRRREWWVATAWSAALLLWLAASLVWLEQRHVFSRQDSFPVEGPLPAVLALLAAGLGASLVAVMAAAARASTVAEPPREDLILSSHLVVVGPTSRP